MMMMMMMMCFKNAPTSPDGLSLSYRGYIELDIPPFSKAFCTRNAMNVKAAQPKLWV